MRRFMSLFILFITLATSIALTSPPDQNISVKQVDKSKVFIFSGKGVDIKTVGTIRVGDTIIIKYGLKLSPNSKGRFIAVDANEAGKRPPTELNTGGPYAPGFMVMDSNQSRLDIHIDHKLIKKAQEDLTNNGSAPLNTEISKDASLNVTLASRNGVFIVKRVDIY